MWIPAVLAGVITFSLFPQATLKTVDPSFKTGNLAGKRIACIDSSVTKNGILTLDASVWASAGVTFSILPDLDGIYARTVFDSTYIPSTTYTAPLVASFCEIIAEKEGALLSADSTSSTEPAEYRLVLQSVKVHHRVSMTALVAIQNVATDNTVARIVVDAEDKFGFGGKGRFQKGFETLRKKLADNLKADYDRGVRSK